MLHSMPPLHRGSPPDVRIVDILLNRFMTVAADLNPEPDEVEQKEEL